jgi:hypothetical protein
VQPTETRSKSQFFDGIKIVKRLKPAKVDGGEISVIGNRSAEIAPVQYKHIGGRASAFFALISDLDSEINERRDSDKDPVNCPSAASISQFIGRRSFRRNNDRSDVINGILKCV